MERLGAAAFGTKRGRMPSTKVSITRLYGWSSSGGFAEAACLEAEPGSGRERIIEDLVGGPPSQVSRTQSEAAEIEGSQSTAKRLAADASKVGKGKSSGGVARIWAKQPPLEEKVDISWAQGCSEGQKTCGRKRIQRCR